MIKLKIKDVEQRLPDDDSCLEWLKNQLFPDGIKCSNCKKVTKHHKVARRRCYVCDRCGNHLYPAAGTIFHKSPTPLITWFKVIHKMQNSNRAISAREIQRENGLTYKTACRMVKKIKESLQENSSISAKVVKTGGAATDAAGSIVNNMVAKQIKKETSNTSKNPEIGDYSKVNPDQEEGLGKFYSKRDRTARLLKLQMLLYQHSQGLNIEEIASRCATSKRTVYRDLKALESELCVPVWEEGNRRGIAEGFFLPPISITATEATIVFLAARLLHNFNYLNNPGLISTFMKLNTIVPLPLRKEIQHTLEYLERQPRDARKINNFNKLIQAWLTQHKVKILCQYIDEEKPLERTVEIYFIEPSIIGGSSYVIAYCHLKKTTCAFKLERIIGEVIIETETYEIPADFNAVDYLGSAWGIQTDKEIQNVKLHFKARISQVAAEYYLHPTQSNEVQEDGSVIMTLKVRDNIHFRNWIIGWADKVEVLEPETLRKQIYEVAESLLDIYKGESIKEDNLLNELNLLPPFQAKPPKETIALSPGQPDSRSSV